MRILVTGASGFIGGHLCRTAVDSGHEVLGLIRKNSATGAKTLRFCEGTLAQPSWREITEFHPDACLHAAWHAKPGAFWDAAENERCVSESRSFISKLWSRTGCHVVATGTCAEYMPSPHLLSEADSILQPESGYARTKHLLHQQLEEQAKAEGRTLSWARIFYPYGPGEPPVKLTSALISAAMRDETLVLHHPESIKDFIYIDDVARALLGLLETRAEGPINIASGRGVRIEELARAIMRMIGKGRIVIRPAATRDSLNSMIGDIGQLKKFVPFFPSFDLEKGLELLWASLSQ
jgi:dTDP-6-deoxy-L-talose 4-dehydrogenase (NAD+)